MIVCLDHFGSFGVLLLVVSQTVDDATASDCVGGYFIGSPWVTGCESFWIVHILETKRKEK